MKINLLFAQLLTLFLLTFSPTFAQELVPDKQEIYKARVTEIIQQEERAIPGTDADTIHQTLSAEILEGATKGTIVTVENDYLQLKQGETFYLTHVTNDLDGTDYYTVFESYRLPGLIFLIVLFVVLAVIFGGKQGVRGLLTLLLSLIVISELLLPGVIGGYSPVLLSMGTASLIIVVGSYITHGVRKSTTAAVIGMIATICLTTALSYLAVWMTKLSGFSNEEAVYLNFNTQGSIDFVGLLLGGILIGLLGVLYDAAIGQAVAVEELAAVGSNLSRKQIFMRALRIGREHIGALINTLAIAYVGAALPLLLLFYSSESTGLLTTINREIFATEIVRILLGSIGVILAVPITTFVATYILVKNK